MSLNWRLVSLEFSQKDLSDRDAKKIKSIEDNVSRIQATMKKHLEKTIYLYNESRRNNLHFKGLLEDDNETWDETEAKVKIWISSSKNSIFNLLQKLNVVIAQAVLGGKMELQNRERSFVSLQNIKQRR